MGTRDEYVTQMKAKLDEWNAEIDGLEAESRKAKAQARQQFAAQIATLRGKRDEAQAKLNELQGASEDAWEGLKSGVQQMWEDFTNTLKECKDAFSEGLREEAKR